MKLLNNESRLKVGDVLLFKEGLEIPSEKLAILNNVSTLIVSETGNSVIKFEGCGEEVFSKKFFIKEISLGCTFNLSKEQIKDRRLHLHVREASGNLREVRDKELIKIENNIFYTETEQIPLNNVHHIISRLMPKDKVIIPSHYIERVTTDENGNNRNVDFNKKLFPNPSIIKGKVIRKTKNGSSYTIKLESQGYINISNSYVYIYSAGKIKKPIEVNDNVLVKSTKDTGVVTEIIKTSSCTYVKVKLDNGKNQVYNIKKIKQLK